jgi:hypothetical protein
MHQNRRVSPSLRSQESGYRRQMRFINYGRSYGAKEMLKRFGLPILNEAVSKVRYPGLDLSHLRF